MSVVANPRIFSVAVKAAGHKEMIIEANPQLPSVTAQDVGREIYHGRHEVVRIVGDKNSLQKIAWIFQRVPDMFAVRFQNSSLIVRRASGWRGRQKAIKMRIGSAVRFFATYLTSKLFRKLF
jgi:hypothetical protein